MKLMYIKNDPKSASHFCNIVGWQGWLLDYNNTTRILVQCDAPDDTVVGCMVKGKLEFEIEKPMLEKELSSILHVEFTFGQVWQFILDDAEYKTIFCAMLDMAFNQSGISDEEFKEYVKMYRSKEAQQI